ncbi:YpmS family protein [Streptococcus loxodontisalivarius]|uniref:Uncharacterized protein YpmS n=1 Tax=Streptococcus loxodontisalivarius TaxID=1349415 RepID=A0ABS2PUJ5_9STRE|nr:YpmS family protein [Streptococcus loxodontisalivarius]MBM7643185.1 uncharacterized protein YpmS [Streptococcus loxodontisalivarius]
MKQKLSGKNLWKWAFILLLSFNIALTAVIASRILTPQKTQQVITSQNENSIEVGTVTLTRENLNQTLASYLESYQTDKMTYQLTATSTELIFQGTYNLLGYDIPLYLYMEPSVLKSGAIKLEVTSVSVGSLGLPKSQVLQYIASSYDLPDIVSLDSKKATIELNIQDLEQSSGIYFKANQIDLKDNLIKFIIYKKK